MATAVTWIHEPTTKLNQFQLLLKIFDRGTNHEADMESSHQEWVIWTSTSPPSSHTQHTPTLLHFLLGDTETRFLEVWMSIWEPVSSVKHQVGWCQFPLTPCGCPTVCHTVSQQSMTDLTTPCHQLNTSYVKKKANAMDQFSFSYSSYLTLNHKKVSKWGYLWRWVGLIELITYFC